MQDYFRPFKVLEDECFPCGYRSLALAADDFSLCRNDVLREGWNDAALVNSPIPGGYRVRRGVGLGGEEQRKREGYGEKAFTCNAPRVSSEWVGGE